MGVKIRHPMDGSAPRESAPSEMPCSAPGAVPKIGPELTLCINLGYRRVGGYPSLRRKSPIQKDLPSWTYPSPPNAPRRQRRIVLRVGTSAGANPNDVTRADAFQQSEHLGNQCQQVIEGGRSSLQNHHRNRPAHKSLLIRQILVNRD